MKRTGAEIERVRQLWCEEGWLASEIGEAMGMTKNAVIGITHRHKMSANRSSAALAEHDARRNKANKQARAGGKFVVQPRPPKPSKPTHVRRASPIKLPQPQPRVKQMICEPVSFWNLEPWSCRWPIGDMPLESLRFCGKSAKTGPYCTTHRKMSYQTGAKNAATQGKFRFEAKETPFRTDQ